MSSPWEILPPTCLPDSVPPLLFKYNSDADGYTIYLTDLTYIWSESLNHEQVIQRSLEEETSIEPKDGPDQLRILLAKVGDGLRGSDETNLNLLSENDGKHLRLNIFARLPSPFRPLQWPIHLTPLASEALKTEFLIPILANQKALKQQVASLLAHIKEKDNVILRLTDKLESSGVDMMTIFPGATRAKVGRLGLGREMAAKVVPGLAAFNEDSWRKVTCKAETRNGNAEKIISSLFPNEVPDLKNIAEEHPSNAWWSNLPRKAQRLSDASYLLIRNNKDHAQSHSPYQHGTVASTEVDIDEEFERQATPPLRKKIAITQTPEALEGSLKSQSKQQDSVTESPEGPTPKAYPTPPPPRRIISGDTQHTTSVARSHDPPPQEPASKAKKLGRVGGRAHVKVLGRQQAGESETLSTTGIQLSSSTTIDHVVESDEDRGKTRQHSPPSTSASLDVRHRLGIIGGKRKIIEGDASDMHPKPATSPASPYRPSEEKGNREGLNASTRPARLLDEKVGEHQKSSSYLSRTPPRSGSPSAMPSAPQAHITPPPESSQERADRKRAELRKAIEEKAKAPTQKRRRF